MLMNVLNKSKYIILLNGHAGCLKTTLAYHLAANFSFALVTNSTLGGFVVDASSPEFMKMRLKRYEKAFVLVEHYLNNNVSVVVDGNYPSNSLRERIYNLAEKYNYDDVISVTCICSEKKALNERFKFRTDNPFAPDSHANSINSHFGSEKEFEDLAFDIFKEKNISQIVFDSCKFEAKIANSNSYFVQILYEFVNKIIQNNSLTKPFFIEYNNENNLL